MLQEVEDACVRFLVVRLEARDILKNKTRWHHDLDRFEHTHKDGSPGVAQAFLLPRKRKRLAGRPRGVDVHGWQRRVIAAHDVWAHAAGGDREVVLGHSPRSLVILRREDQV